MSGGHARTLLPIALGLADGILNALTLAAASLIGSGVHVTIGLAVRISIAALVTAGFSVFVATYSEARGGLLHASRQLSLSAEEGLVDTQLGRDALRRALGQAALASASSMLGALVPLLIAVVLPGPTWIAAVVAIVALGALGVGLATTVAGSRSVWATVLMVGGIGVAAVGVWINIA
jgi:VIT1/CCC1 family predicted Fe2+/Mn2+ transporter